MKTAIVTTLSILLLFFCAGSTTVAQTEGGLLVPFGGKDDDAYVNWLEGSSYPRFAYLPKAYTEDEDGVALHWSIVEDHIYLAVAVRAQGWVGFGLTENGAMRGADMVIFEAATNEVIDAYVLDALRPLRDDCQSWTLLNSQTEGGFLIFEVARPLVTGDTQDRDFIDDSDLEFPPVKVLAAWGDDESFTYHGPRIARASLRFFKSQEIDERKLFEEAMEVEADGYFLVQAKDFLIPPQVTTYRDVCVSEQDLIAQGVPMDIPLHIIGTEPELDPRGTAHLHHYLLYGTTKPNDCEGPELVAAWAPGALPHKHPSNVGIPLAGSNGFRSFRLNIHYNNPNLLSGVQDSSGLKLYYTSKTREYDLGILQLGDPVVTLSGRKVGDGLAVHDFVCRSECSTFGLKEPITVVREELHMHQTGRRMVNEHFRGNVTLHSGASDFYDFEQQGNQDIAREAFEIQPGDSFRTRCYYDAQENEVFGLGSRDEMCIAFLFYYPRQTLFGNFPLYCGSNIGLGDFQACNATYTMESLATVEDLGRTFGKVPATCPAQVSVPSTSSAITWRNSMVAGFLSVSLPALQFFLGLA